MDSTLKRTWAEIDLDALAHNYNVLRKYIPESRFLGVVKADAYGHGAIEVARVLEELGADYLGVSNIDEARELRLAGISLPILQMGMTPANQTEQILKNNVTQTVWSENSAKHFSQETVRLGGHMKVHVKLDTGMSRLGFQCDDDNFASSLEAICRIADLPGLELEGIFTHFAVSDEDSEESQIYTILQHKRFASMVLALKEHDINFPICHCANSGATASYPQFAHDMFRPGIITYGIGYKAENLGLRPVMTIKTIVGCIKNLAADTTVSYGRTFSTSGISRIGVLPIGYADGLPRSLSNKWQVWTPYGKASIVGNICMDMCMIDLTRFPQVKEGDEVEVYGTHNSVNDAAHLAGTIPYELTCNISKRVPRIYLQDGEELYHEQALSL